MGMQGLTGLAEVLFSKTQRRVLGLLFGNTERSFYANEVMRFADIGIGTVQRELEAMSSCGLLTVSRIGNQKHFQANRACPIFDELRGIVLKTFGMADVLRKALAPVRDRIEVAFVYGSVAKGTDHSGSDIDLMILSDRTTYPEVLEAMGDSVQALGRVVNPVVYKVLEFRRKLAEDSSFLRRVMEHPKIYVIGSEDDLPEPRKSRKGR